MTRYYFVEPLDTLMLRGNLAFGAGGEHGKAQLPPWPSVFAGAFRSAMLTADADALEAFEQGERPSGPIGHSLGDIHNPGAFRLTWLSLARAGNNKPEGVFNLPSDLIATKTDERIHLNALQPAALPGTCNSSQIRLPLTPLLKSDKQVKPQSARLDQSTLAAHLRGEPVSDPGVSELYQTETRLGIALDAVQRTAAEGKLYTTETIRFHAGCGFLVGLQGMEDALPDSGMLRLGGDGRGAVYRRVDYQPPQADLTAIGQHQAFRLILATPGIFTDGWLPPAIKEENNAYRLQTPRFSARLAAASVSRNETVSGWDLARNQPKLASKTAPAGSVYWFDQFSGDPAALSAWADQGLWDESPDPFRQAEGFNRAWLANWKPNP